MLIRRAFLLIGNKYRSLTEFSRSVGLLVGGAALAQVVSLLVLPLLTRIYSPENFSFFAVYSSLVVIVSSVACLRLELAIPIPIKDRSALVLLALALSFSFIVSVFFLFGIWLFAHNYEAVNNESEILSCIWLLPLGVWLASSYSAVQFWVSRKKRYSVIAYTRVCQALGGAGTQLGFGWVWVSPVGLVVGLLVTSAIGIFGLVRGAMTDKAFEWRMISLSRMRTMLYRYRHYPQYSVLEALANNGGIQAPLIFIAYVAVGPEAGFLMLALRVMQTPMSMIGASAAQVYLAQAPVELRSGTLASFTAGVLGKLIKVGVGPLLFGCIVAPNLFSIVFGEEWRRAGELAFWMMPWLIMQLLASPISMVMYVQKKQAWMLLLTLGGFVIRCGMVIAAALWSPDNISEAYVASGAVFYFICFILFSRASGMDVCAYFRIFKEGGVAVSIWLFLAVLFGLVIGV